jgi:hypothetical protein
LVPFWVKYANGRTHNAIPDLLCGLEGLFFHDPFNDASFAIDGVEFARKIQRHHIVIGCQATDP